ncbi:protein kinase domain-containing protein [Archangium lansingense]|uniref:protein kinase domain-containing protein n=1 Tax=Archangium lansingense TaxID=2995310 RepID=UPI003B795C9F
MDGDDSQVPPPERPPGSDGQTDDRQVTPSEVSPDSLEASPSKEDRDSFERLLEKAFRFSPLDSLGPQPGERLGGQDGRRFEILRGLGRGGMGQVVRARDEVLHRIVALKFIAPGREFSGRELDKLLQDEARLVAQLDHENIVRIFDISAWNGSPFLIMECLEGQSLEALLRRGPLELRRALRILSDITAGLAHAHSRQIIHRDLKPSNVFILRDGRAKLLDFGLARFASSLGVDVERSGTPAFMAPEQWRGRTQDPRTDVWAAGVLLYLMLTGDLPYPIGDKPLRDHVLSDEPVPPVRMFHPELPEPVDRFLARALAKAPELRFQSALEMRERLRVLEWSLFPFTQAPPPRFVPHRRQVTLVCCRFSGSLGSFDAEDLSELQSVFHQECSGVIERHGGWVPLRMGDEVMGCFGYPMAREEDVVSAVRAALELSRLAERLPRASELELAVHVGVHTDLVVLEVPAPSGQKALSLSMQGEAPRVASWLAGQAAPHSAFLSEKTWQGARGTFVAEALGWKVFYSSLGAARVGVHRLVGESPEPTRFKRAQARGLTPLVGRTRELHQLLARWEAARKGQGVMLLLSGEAGIGKSRLIQELCEHAVRAGARCVSSQCWPQLSRSAFHPVIEWLVHLIGLEPESPAARRWARLEEMLRGLDMPLPEGLQLLGPLLDLPPREEQPLLLSPEQQRERTLETLATFLLRLTALFPGEDGPGSLLLVMEDLHWADPSTLRLLTLLRERIESAGLCLVLSTRPEQRLSWPPHPGLHPIMLERLGADETARMIRRLIGRDSGLTAEAIARLVKQTEGIPLFIEEMSRMVLTRAPSGEAASPVGPLPVTLQELCMARLDPLPQEQKELAWTAAVLGRSFTQGQLAALSERDSITLRRELEELVELGLLLRKGEEAEDPHYEFRHVLLQEAAYESLLKPRRRHYHQRVARLLEHPPSGVTTAPPELIAHHYTQAGELDLAIRFWAQAGELALKRSAFEESISHLEQALRLFERLPEADRRMDEKLRFLVLLGQALVAGRAYSAPEVTLLYENIGRLFHDVRDASVLVAACRGLANQNMMRLNFPLTGRLAEQIVSLGERIQVPQLLVVGRWMGGMSHLLQGHVAKARRLFCEAVDSAALELELEPQALGVLEPEPLAMARAYAGVALILGCEKQSGQRLIDASLRRAERLGHPYTFLLVGHAACIFYQMRFEAHRVLELTERQRPVYEQHPFLRLESWTPVQRGWALVLLGQREEGQALLLEGLAHLRRVHAETGWPYLLCLLADAHLRLGQSSEGLAAVAEGLAWAERTGQHLEDSELYRLRGEFLLRNGETARALNDFHEAIQSARRAGALCIELRATLRLYQLLREQGRGSNALRLLRELVEPLSPHLDSPELRVARELLARVQGEHSGEHELDWLVSASPWDGGHIPQATSPTVWEPL